MQQGGDAAVRNLGPGSILVSKAYADDNSTKVGDTLRITTPVGKRIAPKVTGIVNDKGGLTAKLVITNAVAAAQFGEPKDAFGLVGTDPGTDVKQVQDRIDKLLTARFPASEVLTNKEFKNDVAGQVNQLLGLIYALLALAIIVSLFGIVNTLVLSIMERTRELSMLRAVGASRRQVRRMVRYESVITTLIGTTLGLGLGTLLAFLCIRAIDGVSFALPVVHLAVVVAVAAVLGVLAAVFPARRASRLDPLAGLQYE